MIDARRRSSVIDPDALRAFGVRQLYRVGWRVGARLPRRAVDVLVRRAARRTRLRGGWHVANLRRNLGVVSGTGPTAGTGPTGGTGPTSDGGADDALVEAALASHFRNVYEQLALPGAADRLVAGVTTTGEADLRAAHAAGGAVVALPHSGNWDLAGAWACRTGFPVTTVAERLGDAEFAAFTEFRTRLGMEVIAHGDPEVVPRLVDAVRRGRVVCLLADRDLPGDGVPVRFAGRSVTMPVGPALVAQRSGAALFPTVSQFVGRSVGSGMVLRIGPQIALDPGPDGLATATQRVADVFTARIAERSEDWHLLQPFFADDPADHPAKEPADHPADEGSTDAGAAD